MLIYSVCQLLLLIPHRLHWLEPFSAALGVSKHKLHNENTVEIKERGQQ